MKKILARLAEIDKTLAEYAEQYAKGEIQRETYNILGNRRRWERVGIIETLKAFGIELVRGEAGWTIRPYEEVVSA